MSSNEVKQIALARMANNEELALIAADLDVKLATLLRWKNELMRSIKNGAIDELIDVDAAVLANLGAMVKAQPIASIAPVAESVAKVTEGLIGLQKLQAEVQSTASLAVLKLRQFLSVCDSSSELTTLIETLSVLNDSFFNSKSTQVNIQNNLGGGDAAKAYGEFLNDVPPNQESVY